MSRLEERYRLVLRLLPASYRAAWEEEMVAAFLDSMATNDSDDAEYLAEFGWPSRSEMASVVALAVRLRLPAIRLRLGTPGAPPRYAASGEGIRRAVLALLLVHAAFAMVGLGAMLWLLGKVPAWVPPAPVEWTQAGLSGRGYVTFALVGLAWPVAYLALVLGYRRVGQWSASAAVAGDLVHQIERVVFGEARSVVAIAANVLFGALLLAALLAFRWGAPAARGRSWFVLFGAGVAVAAGFIVLTSIWQPDEALLALLDWPGIYSALLVPAAVGYLVVALVRSALRSSPWSLALALLASAVLGLRLLTLPDLPPGAVGLGGTEALALAAVCVPMAALAARTLRRLSPVPVGAPGGSLG
jgi:hypothetical protein